MDYRDVDFEFFLFVLWVYGMGFVVIGFLAPVREDRLSFWEFRFEFLSHL